MLKNVMVSFGRSNMPIIYTIGPLSCGSIVILISVHIFLIYVVVSPNYVE